MNTEELKFKGIKQKWKRVGDSVRVDYIASSFLICNVCVDMPYPSTKIKGEAHMSLILAAPDLLKTCQEFIKLDPELEELIDILNHEDTNKANQLFEAIQGAKQAIEKALKS
ncbi:MAG: hypothetical protein F6K19_01490 [Cyanothece sp. SIO1E1]|nr:hypothetical protein [Cyanothece sp. SIO1E1]